MTHKLNRDKGPLCCEHRRFREGLDASSHLSLHIYAHILGTYNGTLAIVAHVNVDSIPRMCSPITRPKPLKQAAKVRRYTMDCTVGSLGKYVWAELEEEAEAMKVNLARVRLALKAGIDDNKGKISLQGLGIHMV